MREVSVKMILSAQNNRQSLYEYAMYFVSIYAQNILKLLSGLVSYTVYNVNISAKYTPEAISNEYKNDNKIKHENIKRRF